jgi:PAS domain S-box-containing protein
LARIGLTDLTRMEAAHQAWLQRYGAAVLFTAVAFALRLALEPWLGTHVSLLTFFPAVALTVWYAGAGPAILAAVLSIFAMSLSLTPYFRLEIDELPAPMLHHLLYVTGCALIIVLGESARRRGEQAELANEALQESERRHRFLVALDDALRNIADPWEIKKTAADMLGEHLDASHVAYQEFDAEGESFTVVGDYTRDARALSGNYRMADFGSEAYTLLRQGEPFVSNDIEHHEPAPESMALWRRAGIRAIVSVPLHKAGCLVAVMSVTQKTPRVWTSYELELVPRVVGRCWESVERALAESALRAGEAEFRALFELSTMGVAEADPATGRFLRANARFCEITGRSLEEVLNSTFESITHPDDVEQTRAVVGPVMRGEAQRWEFEKRYVRPDGTVVWVIVAGRLITDERGRPLRTIASAADVTARRHAEERLRESVRRFRVAQESSLMAFTIFRAERDESGAICDFIWEYINAAASAYLGMKPEELVGRRMMDIFPTAKSDSTLFDSYVRVVETGEPHDIEIPFEGDGVTRVFQNISSKLEDGVASWYMDITERKRMEADVAASRGELRLVTDTAAVMLAHCDHEARILFVNRSYAERFERQPEELVGLHIADVVERETYRVIEPYVAEVLTGRRVDFELELPHARLGLRYMQCTYVPEMHSGSGAAVGFVASLSDITERRRLEQQLREADQRKDEFLATLAHELRNPLAPIRSAIDYIKLTSPAEPGMRRAQEIVERQTALLTRLVDDLLDLSRLSRGRVELRREQVDLAIALQDALESCRPLMEGATQEFTVNVPEQTLFVYGDLARLSQVFANLLNNAAKFTPAGGQISLTAGRCDGEVVVRISDTGSGFPAEAAHEIFEMFAQGPSSAERLQSGLGIGLTLVRQLVELHGGRVEAHSPGPGMGSTFTVRLPASKTEAAEAPTPEQTAPREQHGKRPGREPRRVLVCDDNEDAALMLAMLLRSLGHSVHTVHDGLMAVQQTEKLHPEIVILDIGMPRMDGYEAARRIRSLPGGGDIRLIALTGWGQDKDKQRARDAGFDEHLTKPVDGAVLERLVAG